MTWRIGSTAGLASSRYASQRQRQPPLARQPGRRGRLQLRELLGIPIGESRPAGRLLLGQRLLRLHQARVFGFFRNRIVFLLPPGELDVILVRQGEDVPFGIKLRPPARPNICCAAPGSISFFLSRGPLTSVVSTTDRAGRLIPAASVSVQTQTGSSFS